MHYNSTKLKKNLCFKCFSSMSPKKNVASKKQKTTAANTSRTQMPFDCSRFVEAKQEEKFRELERRCIWAEKRFTINEEGDHKMLVHHLELWKWGTLINPHKNLNYDVIHKLYSSTLSSEGEPFSFTTMVRGRTIYFNRE